MKKKMQKFYAVIILLLFIIKDGDTLCDSAHIILPGEVDVKRTLSSYKLVLTWTLPRWVFLKLFYLFVSSENLTYITEVLF